MLNLFPTRGNVQSPSRRDLLKMAAVGAAGLSLPDILRAEQAFTPAQAQQRATAKNCIYIFLCGGPSQIDMWDPKPEAPSQIRGPIGSIETNVPGIRIGELLPTVAQHADKFSIIRSQHAYSASHNFAIMDSLLGQKNPKPGEPFPTRSDHPGFGAILHKLLGGGGELPAWVTLPRPFTTGTDFYKGQTAGFLGPAYDSFLLNKPKKSSLSTDIFKVDSLAPIDGVNNSRLTGRKNLLDRLGQHSDEQSELGRQIDQHYDTAFSLLSESGAKRAFDLTLESEGTLNRYGRNEYGQSFLLARRMVEAGVRMVNVFWTFFGPDGCQFNLWDNHGIDGEVCGGYRKGIEMIKAPYCCPSFDRCFSALLEDLQNRGLLDETLVVVTGEFGRTPRINKTAGRDHWAGCQSTVIAGGGIRGGQIYGSTDAQAGYVKENPVLPDDIGATIHHAFGLLPETPVHDQQDRPVRISEGQPVIELFG